MWDVATLNQLLVLANLESYNAVLIKLGNGKKNRIFSIGEMLGGYITRQIYGLH